VLDLAQAAVAERDVALTCIFEDRDVSHDGRPEQEHARIAVLADDPRVHAARMHAAFAGDGIR
jgi:hypothetical protein